MFLIVGSVHLALRFQENMCCCSLALFFFRIYCYTSFWVCPLGWRHEDILKSQIVLFTEHKKSVLEYILDTHVWCVAWYNGPVGTPFPRREHQHHNKFGSWSAKAFAVFISPWNWNFSEQLCVVSKRCGCIFTFEGTTLSIIISLVSLYYAAVSITLKKLLKK